TEYFQTAVYRIQAKSSFPKKRMQKDTGPIGRTRSNRPLHFGPGQQWASWPYRTGRCSSSLLPCGGPTRTEQATWHVGRFGTNTPIWDDLGYAEHPKFKKNHFVGTWAGKEECF